MANPWLGWLRLPGSRGLRNDPALSRRVHSAVATDAGIRAKSAKEYLHWAAQLLLAVHCQYHTEPRDSVTRNGEEQNLAASGVQQASIPGILLIFFQGVVYAGRDLRIGLLRWAAASGHPNPWEQNAGWYLLTSLARPAADRRHLPASDSLQRPVSPLLSHQAAGLVPCLPGHRRRLRHQPLFPPLDRQPRPLAPATVLPAIQLPPQRNLINPRIQCRR